MDVTVTTPSGTSATGSADQFTYESVACQPSTAISPSSGPAAGGTPVPITGTELTGATAVSFGAAAATNFTVDGATQITATSPAGAGTVDVTVTTPSGSSATTSADQFTYITPPSGTTGNSGIPGEVTPTTQPTGAVVGSSGGTLSTADGAFSLTSPAGAIAGSGTLGVTEACPPPAPTGAVRASCVFTLVGPTLTSPQPATTQYNTQALGTLPAGRLSVYRQNADGTWSFVPTAVDAATGTVRAYVSGPETIAVLADTQTFSDIPAGYSGASAIDAVVAALLANGFPDGTFQLNGALTRAQLVKMLDLALGIAPSDATTPFSDVAFSDWYAPYVSADLQVGLVQGLTATTFGPNDTVSREQMAVLLARALKLTDSGHASFTDASQIDSHAQAAVQAVVAGGYMTGFPDGTFQPLAPTPRAQAAQALAEVIAHLAP